MFPSFQTGSNKFILEDRKNSSPEGINFITINKYDDSGRLTEQILPDGNRLSYRYNPTHGYIKTGKPEQLNSILFNQKIIVKNIEQTMIGGITSYTLSNNIQQNIKFNNRGQIEKIFSEKNKFSNENYIINILGKIKSLFKINENKNNIYSQINTYDSAERLISIKLESQENPQNLKLTISKEHYSYDEINRLKNITIENEFKINLTYDKLGNRLTEKNISTVYKKLNTEDKVYHYIPGTNKLIAITTTSKNENIENIKIPSNQKIEFNQRLMSAWLYHDIGVPLLNLLPKKRNSSDIKRI